MSDTLDDFPFCTAHRVRGCEACEHDYSEQNDDDTMTCPEHGEQPRTDSYSTRGPDPYGVDVGACGCHVIGFGKDDLHVLKRVGRVLGPDDEVNYRPVDAFPELVWVRTRRT